MIRDLATLLAPHPEALFLEHFNAKKRLFLSNGRADFAAALFPWTAIDRLIESGAVPPAGLSVLMSGVQAPMEMYRQSRDGGPIRALALRSLMEQGASLVLHSIDEADPRVGRLSAALERRLGCRVWTNAYLGFGPDGALKVHCDLHDVIVLQIHGRKIWRSYGGAERLPVERVDEPPTRQPEWTAELSPGDILYLPRGEFHDTKAIETPSVHLTLGLRPARGLDFLAAVMQSAAADRVLRMDLPRMAEEGTLQDHETRLKAAFKALVEGASLSAFLEREDARRPPAVALNLGIEARLGPGVSVVAALRRRPDLTLRREGDVEVVVGGQRMRLSAPVRRALDLLLKTEALRFDELARRLGLDEGATRHAVLELCRRGLATLDSDTN